MFLKYYNLNLNIGKFRFQTCNFPYPKPLIFNSTVKRRFYGTQKRIQANQDHNLI